MSLEDLAAIVDDRLGDARSRRADADEGHRLLVGIAGPVAVGKSTVAAQMVDHLDRRGIRAVAVGTDRYLQPNRVLAERGLAWRKGFPESYDRPALVDLLRRARRPDARIDLPVYSHEHYDVVEGLSTPLRSSDVLVVEGVNALQPPMRPLLDLGVYVDAPEPDVRAWFVTRFVDLCRAGADDDQSFYRQFAQLDDAAVVRLATDTWNAVNGPNLAEHIAPTRSTADVVVHKGPDHRIARIEPAPARR